MTVQDLRDLLAGLSGAEGELEVCRHDSEYGARTLETVEVVYEVVGRRYRWTYDTSEEAAGMANDGETIAPVVLLR